MESTRGIAVTRCGTGHGREERDEVAVEEPLEIRLDGHPVAVLMRTPGHDEELGSGFLVTEGIILKAGDLRKIEARPDENRLLVFLEENVPVDLGRLTRHVFAGSSCGLCGKATLEAVFASFPPISKAFRPEDDVLLEAPGKLLGAQGAFATTGGLHAAGIFSKTGELMVVREDIGRHNAVDKVIGRALLDGTDLSTSWLLVSGRISFEIMQKALAARIPAIAGISAPTSLAVDFAKASGQELIGFLRPPGFNRY